MSSDAEFVYFIRCYPDQTVEQTTEMPVIWGAMSPTSRHSNVVGWIHDKVHLLLL